MRHKRIYEGDRFDAIVARTAEFLATSRWSKFEFEGVCRTAIRMKLVLSGHRWEPSDQEAARIVGAALNRINARRPTWEQGQPDYTTGPDYCQRCHTPLPDDEILRGHSYCSKECAELAYRARLASHIEKTDRVWASLKAAYLREAVPRRKCAHCAKEFRPLVHGASYCSTRCARLSRGDAVPDRNCNHCGKLYHPPTITVESKYCSTACAADAAGRPKQPCEVCGKLFRPRRAGRTTCSRACSLAAPSKLPASNCIVCGTEFVPKTKWSVYCGATCRNRRNHDLERERRQAKARQAEHS